MRVGIVCRSESSRALQTSEERSIISQLFTRAFPSSAPRAEHPLIHAPRVTVSGSRGEPRCGTVPAGDELKDRWCISPMAIRPFGRDCS